MNNKAYVTTPIYYVNDVPHIGHAYTTIIADTMARYYRLKGRETYFLTGTDEHGQKIEEAAKSRNRNPQEYADEISGKFKALWDDFDISYDKFIRTTDADHKLGVQKAFKTMFDKGDIYKGDYEGHYCVSCETFFTETQLIDGDGCPDCGKPTNLVKEESYFFKLSSYQEQLLKWYHDDEQCVLPKGKKNEVISFVKQGLRDLSITRTSFDWGVKLPEEMGDPKHVMYVWLDALLNYVTALGYGKDEENMDFWPATMHLVGKDILRFHAIYWPAFLMSLGLPLPTHIAAHGWWTRNGEKMSKSKGNVVNPKEVADAYGLENFRYFMLREVPFGQDGDFSQKALIDRINSDLGNEFGNLLNRIIGMSGKYSQSAVTSKDVKALHVKELSDVEEILDGVEKKLNELQTNRYLEDLWKVLTIANGAITAHEPWVKIKNGDTDGALAVVGLVANILARVTVLVSPVMPKTSSKIAAALGFEINTESYTKLIQNRELLNDFVIEKIPPLFPRIEEEAIETPEPSTKPEVKKKKETKTKEESIITIDQFFETSLKIGTILEAEEVPKSDRLLKLKVDVGEENPRQVIAGIKEYYAPADLINTQVCIVANLKPAKIMGMLSQGMLLAAKDKDGLALMRPETPKKSGSSVG
ncbi:methionine--tRNA ligase [Sulfurospirillum arcachonense]|uniref:methionine--tRNA ligase n=1 Tax=Sulfurospirillum arcachonense TaxID=57666 RepID=UPI00046A10F1|nr:methionine--tRNA ligase [Sulfurospirillum arcachonense]